MGPILETFHRTCRDRREEHALWSRGEGLCYTFHQLARQVDGWQERLPAEIGEGVAALATGNGAAFVELFFALLRRGVPVALVDGGLPHGDKLTLCRRLGLLSLLHRDEGHHGEEPAGEELGAGVRLRRLAGLEPSQPPPGTAVIKLTSGSTGDPVGICLSEEALAQGIAQIAAGMEIGAADRVLVSIPLSHSYGFDNGVLSLASVGTPLVLEPGYYPASLLRALDEGKVTLFPAVPPMVRALGGTEWPQGLALRRVICAGGPLDQEFADGFRQRSGRWVHQFYGSTETGGICFESQPQEPESRGTVGRPLPGVRVELDEAGTVVVDSPACFAAYLGCLPRGDRRVELGDRGEWTPEGRLRLVGRTSDLLNVGGRRVSAVALESALKCLPQVEDAAVVGIADPLRGDRLVAFLVGEAGSLEAGRLPPGLALRNLRWLDTLPYTGRGKLDRALLRRLAMERGA